MSTQSEIRRQITDKIVESLKAGTPPWRRPWSDLENAGSPTNVVSRRSYSGVNPLLLELVAQERGYASRWWATFRQWQDLGFRIKARPPHVKSGEWGAKVVFCKPVGQKTSGKQGREDGPSEPAERENRYLLLRTFTVFNAQQIEGDGAAKYLARPRTASAFVDYAPAETVIQATEARIVFGGGKAVYYPAEDFIHLPPKEAFESQKEYYATAFHELGHWSGHESRLNRLVRHARFGDAAYAFEELVAEIAGCFLSSELGLPQSAKLDNQTAYIANWLDVLRRDATAIFTASSQASAATDFILAFSRGQSGSADEDDKSALAGVNG